MSACHEHSAVASSDLFRMASSIPRVWSHGLVLFSQISPVVLSYLHIVQPCGSRDPMDLFCNDVAKWSHREGSESTSCALAVLGHVCRGPLDLLNETVEPRALGVLEARAGAAGSGNL